MRYIAIHHRIVFALIVAALCFAIVSPARAATLGSLFENITNPISAFIHDAEKTVTDAAPRAPSLESIKNIDLKSFEPGAVFANLKTWLSNNIGSIRGFVKRFGTLLADILSYIVNFLRKALELLP